MIQLTHIHSSDNSNQKLLGTDTYRDFYYFLEEAKIIKNKKTDLIIVYGNTTHDCVTGIYDYF